jgi:hypothetical protein
VIQSWGGCSLSAHIRAQLLVLFLCPLQDFWMRARMTPRIEDIIFGLAIFAVTVLLLPINQSVAGRKGHGLGACRALSLVAGLHSAGRDLVNADVAGSSMRPKSGQLAT